MHIFRDKIIPIGGYVIGLISSIVTIATVKGSASIPYWVLLICAYIVIISIVTAVITSKHLTKIRGESNRVAAYEFSKNENNEEILMTEPSNSLRVDTLVTIYYDVPGQKDKKLGYGRVTYESPGENNEIVIKHFIDSEILKDVIAGVKNNKRSYIKRCYVLPNFYSDEAVTAYELIKG